MDDMAEQRQQLRERIRDIPDIIDDENACHHSPPDIADLRCTKYPDRRGLEAMAASRDRM
jgi:hypothetical protein